MTARDEHVLDSVVRRLAGARLPDPDTWLEARDSSPFDDEWCRVDVIVEQRGGRRTDEVRTMADGAFDAVYRDLGGEIAGYVSDDFDLLARAVDAGVEDPWLSGLLSAYTDGTLPAGSVPALSESLNDILRRIE